MTVLLDSQEGVLEGGAGAVGSAELDKLMRDSAGQLLCSWN